jgi:hypothetical protein
MNFPTRIASKLTSMAIFAICLSLCVLILIAASIYAAFAQPPAAPPEHVAAPVTDPRFIAPAKYRAWVMQYAAEFGVPLDIAIRVAYNESTWRAGCLTKDKNGTYDDGVYQLNSRYYRIQLVQSNIRLGLRHLGLDIRRTRTLREALYCYNCGRVTNPPASTVWFADRILGGQID